MSAFVCVCVCVKRARQSEKRGLVGAWNGSEGEGDSDEKGCVAGENREGAGERDGDASGRALVLRSTVLHLPYGRSSAPAVVCTSCDGTDGRSMAKRAQQIKL